MAAFLVPIFYRNTPSSLQILLTIEVNVPWRTPFYLTLRSGFALLEAGRNKTMEMREGHIRKYQMEDKVTKFTYHQPTAGGDLSFQEKERVPY